MRTRTKGLSKSILLALLDNHKLSNIQLARYVNTTVSSINQATYALRQKGLIARQGWARFVLTDAGKMECSRLLPNLPEVVAEEVVTSELPVVPEPDEAPEEPTTPEIDWAREYIKLAEKMAEALTNRSS